MTLKNIMLAVLSVFSASVNSYASDCTVKSCEGLMLPVATQKFISKGYSHIEINSLNNYKYLFLSGENDVNKCSVIFKIDNGKIENTPSAGEDGKLCNVSEINGNIVSSYRDQGTWFNDVYQISSVGDWALLFTDSCADCQQVKRTYYKNSIEQHRELLSEGDSYFIRKPLNGIVLIQKAFLYSQPAENKKIKAYLVKGDEFTLTDMSEDGVFYQINYTSPSGRSLLYWIKSDSFDLK